MLIDTDFDGINDNNDSSKKDNNFKGNTGKIGNIEYNNDFRYFYINNKKYNDELSTMSLMMSNLANGGSAPLHSGSQNILQYMSNLGFVSPINEKHTFRISATENIGGNLYIGKKTIQVGANKKSIKRYKDVYGIFLGGFDTEENYKKLVSNFNKEEIAKYYESITEDIIDYINTNKPPTLNSYCYWVTGYSVAGGIAGEVASRLVNDGEVYCYTFGATNTNTTGSGTCVCIKNVINEDDLYPKIYNIEEGFYRNGMLYNDSIYDNLQKEYREFGGDLSSYKVSPKRTNTIKQKIKQVRDIVTKSDWIDLWLTNLSKYLKNYTIISDTFNDIFHPFQSLDSVQLKNILNSNTNGVKKAHELKSYYVLSKSLNGFDLNNDDAGWTEYDESLGSDEYIDELTEEDEEYQERLNLLLNAIEIVGNAYLDNVYSYQGAIESVWKNDYNLKDSGSPRDGVETRITDLDTTRNAEHVTEIISGQERVLKTSTVAAYEKWNDLKEKIKNKYYPDITFDEFKLKRIMPMVPEDDNKKSVHHLDILDEYAKSSKRTMKNYDQDIDVLYRDEEEDNRADQGSFVCDDCSSFAAAVYWYYLNQIENPVDLDKISLWYTGSSHFVNKGTNNKKNILDVLLDNYFEIYQWKSDNAKKIVGIEDRHNFVLQPGDLLYRRNGQNGASAHVEFYLGGEHSFGWGDIQSSYNNENNSKYFKIIRDLDIYNIGKTRTANQVSNGETYRVENSSGGGIYNTIRRFTDYNCRYDYVIRLKKKINVAEEVENE